MHLSLKHTSTFKLQEFKFCNCNQLHLITMLFASKNVLLEKNVTLKW